MSSVMAEEGFREGAGAAFAFRARDVNDIERGKVVLLKGWSERGCGASEVEGLQYSRAY